MWIKSWLWNYWYPRNLLYRIWWYAFLPIQCKYFYNQVIVVVHQYLKIWYIDNDTKL